MRYIVTTIIITAFFHSCRDKPKPEVTVSTPIYANDTKCAVADADSTIGSEIKSTDSTISASKHEARITQ